MASDLKVCVRRQIDRLTKELAAATGQVATLREEIKRHELIYDMLDGRKTGRRFRRGRSAVGPLKRVPGGAMIDWKAVFATLPGEFTLDTIGAHEMASGEAASLPLAVGRTVVEGGSDQAHRPGHVPENLNSKETGRATCARWGMRFLYSNRLQFAYGDGGG